MSGALDQTGRPVPVTTPEPTDVQIREDAYRALAAISQVRPELEELDVLYRRAAAKISWMGRTHAPEVAAWLDALQMACTVHSVLAQLRFVAEDMTRFNLHAEGAGK